MAVEYYKSKVGLLKISADEEAVIAISFVQEVSEVNGNRWTKECIRQLEEYFQGNRYEFDLPLHPVGTPFQQKVWEALQQIPYGETRSYKEIAIECGNEKACRAVGMANNRNPIAIVIPCHRVIGKNGKLVGYAGGLDIKTFLLELEKNQKRV